MRSERINVSMGRSRERCVREQSGAARNRPGRKLGGHGRRPRLVRPPNKSSSPAGEPSPASRRGRPTDRTRMAKMRRKACHNRDEERPEDATAAEIKRLC